MMEEDKYIQASTKGKNVQSFSSCSEPQHQNPRKKKNKLEKNKRRFSDEQIRSLEIIFESESMLEPRKKLQLARDLGLQPRQVAIWFQNRRARWKSKRMEQEYRKLRDEYDKLASRFESLKNEKESLQLQLQKLRELVGTCYDGRREMKGGKENSTEKGGLEDRECMNYSDDQNEKNIRSEKSEERGQEQHHVLRMDEHEEILPLASTLEKWYNVDPNGSLDQPCSSSQWLDFWT
ncbi:hypothetical protein TanjilG_08089 [Lupinus angustifolius]|uniref:Homeobox-leucine zipper protein n=1 Tax=Lupinus angustifolius TaxID=3871 RepID=A0A394DEZ3_LUPAN|nr:PREDICTED: homeobox-leucine zipper protein ATHB-12-like [Lupinus angustifolius]OIW21686.1 hypothetical protein TanjilG_08089 [Lupinus angustifolius]